MVSATAGLSQTRGATRYHACANCGVRAEGAEVNTQITYHADGTFLNPYIRIIDNSIPAASSFILRKNAASALTVTITASTTGEFENVSSIVIADGDEMNYQLVTGSAASGSFASTIFAVQFADASANTRIRYATVNLPDLSDGTTTYWPLSSDGASSFADENEVRFDFNASCTLKNLFIYVSSNGAAGSGHAVNLRVNGVGVIFKDLGTATGVLENTADSQAVVSGDDVNFSFDSVDTSPVVMDIISIEAVSTNQTFHTLNARPVTQVFATTTWWPLGGSALSTNTESRVKADIKIGATVSNITGYVESNTIIA